MSSVFRTVPTKIIEFIKRRPYASTLSFFIVVGVLYRLRKYFLLRNDKICPSPLKSPFITGHHKNSQHSSSSPPSPEPHENENGTPRKTQHENSVQGSDWNIKDNVRENSSQKKIIPTEKHEPVVEAQGGSARETRKEVPVSSSPLVSLPAPNIVFNTIYETFSLSQHRGRWVILFFYPNNFDAHDEITALNTLLPKLADLEAVLLGFTGVDEFHQQGFCIKHGINFPLLPDPDGKIAESYGISYLNQNHNRTWFLIDPFGTIVYSANTISAENIFPILRQHVRETEKLFSAAREDITKLILEKKCALPLLRLVWEWWQPEDDRIQVARNILSPLKEKYSGISDPDFIQFSGNIAVTILGGPKIPFRFGRAQDSTGTILRSSVSTFGARFEEKDMVVLAFVEALVKGQTEHPGKFSNEYYASILKHEFITKNGEDSSSMCLFPSGLQLINNDSFRKHVEQYAQSQEEFFKDFTIAFQKLQELGYNNLSSVGSREKLLKH